MMTVETKEVKQLSLDEARTLLVEQHQRRIQLELCLRDYDLMTQYHPGLLDSIEAAVRDDVPILQIRRFVVPMVAGEADVIQRCVNAATYIQYLAGEGL